MKIYLKIPLNIYRQQNSLPPRNRHRPVRSVFKFHVCITCICIEHLHFTHYTLCIENLHFTFTIMYILYYSTVYYMYIYIYIYGFKQVLYITDKYYLLFIDIVYQTSIRMLYQVLYIIRSVFNMSCLFLRHRPWQFEI